MMRGLINIGPISSIGPFSRREAIFDCVAWDKTSDLPVLLDGVTAVEFGPWRPKYWHTPLTLAAARGATNAVALLVKAGASTEGRDVYNMTPMDHAIQNGKPKVVSLLIELGASINGHYLSEAAHRDRSEIASYLIAAGADVNWQNESTGSTALMDAAVMASMKTVRVLLGAGANFRLKRRDGRTASQLALISYNPDTCQMIDDHETAVSLVRKEVVETAGLDLPSELAELCGDYIDVTPVRQALMDRAKERESQ